tara:strand:+ start:1072 stop:1455 length:384 start_codon:yes stop_codon:yes gene_type:complete
MKQFISKPLILLTFFISSNFIYSQEEKLNIKQDSRIDSLLKQKIEFDRERFRATFFTLQLYYGDLNLAEEILEQCKEKFPHIPVELSFETPNYKVQAGRFKEKLNGLKTLDTLKYFFPSAFLLSRKN